MVIISANYHSFSQWESLEKHPKASDWCCEHRDIIRLWRSLPVTIGGDSAAVLSCLLYFTIFIMLTFSAFPLETAMAVLHHIKSTDLHSGALATFQWYRLATQSCLLLIVDIIVQFTYTVCLQSSRASLLKAPPLQMYAQSCSLNDISGSSDYVKALSSFNEWIVAAYCQKGFVSCVHWCKFVMVGL